MKWPYQVYASIWWHVDSGECTDPICIAVMVDVLSTGRVCAFTFPRATELFKQLDQR